MQLLLVCTSFLKTLIGMLCKCLVFYKWCMRLIAIELCFCHACSLSNHSLTLMNMSDTNHIIWLPKFCQNLQTFAFRMSGCKAKHINNNHTRKWKIHPQILYLQNTKHLSKDISWFKIILKTLLYVSCMYPFLIVFIL